MTSENRALPIGIWRTAGLLLLIPLSARAQMVSAAPSSGGVFRRLAERSVAAPYRVTGPIVIDSNAGVIPALCPPEAASAGGTCGYLPVPLFRLDDNGARINIYFEVYPHSNPGPAVSAIVPNAGGPGGTTTGMRSLWLSTFGPNMDTHDLLLVDNRGSGQSAAIDCPTFQHGFGPTYADEVAQCADQLNLSNSQWGSGDVAFDIEEVRRALGYDLIDYYGGSWGGNDASAYATRFPQHVRSIILDSSDGPATMVPFRIATVAHAIPRTIRLDCKRSPTCEVDHPDPEDELDALIQTVRNQPVRGYAHDSNGNVRYVAVDELTVALIGAFPNGPFQDTGELLAAEKALGEGDSLPLLRLGAEEPYRVLSDLGDPALFSGGDQLAATCVDLDDNIPYNYREPPSRRLASYHRAVADLPLDFFSPFSVSLGTRVYVDPTHECAYWGEATRHIPLVPERAGYPSAPVLALASDMDTGGDPIEMVDATADLYPASSMLIIPEAFHESVLSNTCSNRIATTFIETLLPGDTSCTQVPETVWPALGRFPKVAADARPAAIDPNGHNQIGLAELKVVTVAVAAVIDAIKRSTIGSGNGVGLRGGTFMSAFNSTGQVTTLIDCAFASDVDVNGSVTWHSASDLSLTANVSVRGRGTVGGSLHISGAFHASGPVGNFRITGQLGGKIVAALLPES